MLYIKNIYTVNESNNLVAALHRVRIITDVHTARDPMTLHLLSELDLQRIGFASGMGQIRSSCFLCALLSTL